MDVVAQLNNALAGRYLIDHEIGAGGMATVYLARDLKHERSVALKVLNPELGAVLGAERFLAEIRVTANLQHPNLLPLFDSGEANGLVFYVMPFVDGETLRARLAREKQLPVNEVARIASAIASALEYAHRHGVIHRDLKPENVLLQGGQPVIADFGIALAVSNAGGARVTQTGLSLGTPQYMSPEQATGDRQIDQRTDIYSLGAMTYEMLVGDPPHLGSTAQAIIAKVLTEKPISIRATRPSVPDHVVFAVEKSLEKLPADRWRTAEEFDAALTGRSGPVPTTALTSATFAAQPRSFLGRASRTPAIAGAAVVLAVISAVGWWRSATRSPPRDTVRFVLGSPPDAKIALSGSAFAISPDGHDIAVVGEQGSGKSALYIRAIDDVTARLLVGTEGANQPFFSPDGRWVGFVVGRQIKKVSVDGGSVVPLADSPGVVSYSPHWGPHGLIVVPTGSELALLPENGGALRLLGADSTPGRGVRWPRFIDEGKTILYTSWSGQASDARIRARDVQSARVVDLGLTAASVLGVVEGRIVYSTGAGTLFAAPFDGKTVQVDKAEQVLDGIATSGQGDRVAAELSENGTLVYQSGSILREVVKVDFHGGATLLVTDQKTFNEPRISPDGKTIAFSISGRSSAHIWLYDMRSGAPIQLTTTGTANTRPEWSADGSRVLYRSNRDSSSSLWWQPIDGSGSASLVLRVPGKDVWEGVLSPVAPMLLYRTGTTGTADIWYRGLNGDTTSREFSVTQYSEWDARFSPNGKWVAYSSDEGGIRQVFVRPFPSGGARTQISINGGQEPVWSRDGRRLFYQRGQAVIMVRIESESPFAVSQKRDSVAVGDFYFSSGHAGYDVMPDGEHLVLLRPVSTAIPTIVVRGWIDELRSRQLDARR